MYVWQYKKIYNEKLHYSATGLTLFDLATVFSKIKKEYEILRLLTQDGKVILNHEI